MSRNTIRAALRSEAPPSYERARAGSKLDPFKDEIHRLLKQDPRMPGQRIRELIAGQGFEGGKTIVDDYLREVRPLFLAPRTFQRTVYRPGEVSSGRTSIPPSIPRDGRDVAPNAPPRGGPRACARCAPRAPPGAARGRRSGAGDRPPRPGSSGESGWSASGAGRREPGNCCSATSMPAAVQRLRMSPSCQRFTLRWV
jgi:hypothetical protein